MTILIKKCTLADLSALQQISRMTFADTFGAYNTKTDLAQYLDHSYSEAQLKQELTNPNSAFYFILVAGVLAGYLKINVSSAQTEQMGDEALEVQRIYILPEFKRQGLGQKLIAQAITVAKKLSKQAIWLGVWENNPDALAFYDRMGFKQIGDHVFNLGDSPQRDLILKKEFDKEDTNK